VKPENRAIRQLEKQLEGASPEVAHQIERVTAALKGMLMRERQQSAYDLKKRSLDDEVKKLSEMMNPGRSRENG
jgi:hypothetical protein